jgi:hypothetical protein
VGYNDACTILYIFNDHVDHDYQNVNFNVNINVNINVDVDDAMPFGSHDSSDE